MESKKLLFLFIVSIALGITVSAQSNILPLQGLKTKHQGIFGWDIIGTKVGHPIPVPYNAFGNDFAYYYIATRDAGSFDPLATTGMHGVGSLTGFSGLGAALLDHGKSLADINIRMATTTLGDDVEGSDWSLIGAIESRKYTAGSYAILLNNDTLLTGLMPELNLVINYHASNTPYDDQTSGYTDYSIPTLFASSGIANSIATAFLNDIGSYGIRLNFNSIQPAGETNYISGNTFGGYFEIQQGQIETGSVATSITKMSAESVFEIYQNAVHSRLDVTLGEHSNFKSLSVVNLLGVKLLGKEIAPRTERVALGIEALKSGVYFCVLEGEHGVHLTRKFIKK